MLLLQWTLSPRSLEFPRSFSPVIACVEAAVRTLHQLMLKLDAVRAGNCQRPFCVHSQLFDNVLGSHVIVLVVETYCNTRIAGITDSGGLSLILRVSHANGCHGKL